MIIETKTTALILAGNGYELTITHEAALRKAQFVAAAQGVVCVTDNDESANAQYHSRRLAQLRIEVEKCRKEVKEPVNKIGKLIDQAAKDFLMEIEVEEKRITRLVGDHAQEVQRLKAQKIREERLAFDAAKCARETAEATAISARSSGTIANVIAAIHADVDRLEALGARMTASEAVAETKVAEGVRFAWDFEVADIDKLSHTAPAFCTIEVKRGEVLRWIKDLESSVENIEDWCAQYGIRAFKRPVVSSR